MVRGVRIPEELAEAHQCLMEFSDGFEQIYVHQRVDRLHFVRACIHALSHLAPETARLGPLILSDQFTTERTNGNLGEEIKQHSNAFFNYEERGLWRCQIDALRALIPDIEADSDRLPHCTRDLGDGFAFRTAKDTAARLVTNCENEAIQVFLEQAGVVLAEDWEPKVVRWARLSLPNGQIARARWKEEKKIVVHMARNVKVSISTTILSVI